MESSNINLNVSSLNLYYLSPNSQRTVLINLSNSTGSRLRRILPDVTNRAGCTPVAGRPPFILKWPRRICLRQKVFFYATAHKIFCQFMPSRSELFPSFFLSYPFCWRYYHEMRYSILVAYSFSQWTVCTNRANTEVQWFVLE